MKLQVVHQGEDPSLHTHAVAASMRPSEGRTTVESGWQIKASHWRSTHAVSEVEEQPGQRYLTNRLAGQQCRSEVKTISGNGGRSDADDARLLVVPAAVTTKICRAPARTGNGTLC